MKMKYCKYCRDPFKPEIHNAWHQKYCTQDACQKARNRLSCRRWRLNHPKDCDNNDDHRVEAWRAQHPGYWRRERRKFLSVDILLPTCRKVDCGVGMRICDREGITLQHVVLKWTPEWPVVCRDMGLTLQNVVAGLKIRGYRLGHEHEESHVQNAGISRGYGSGGPDRAGDVVLSQGVQERTEVEAMAQASGA